MFANTFLKDVQSFLQSYVVWLHACHYLFIVTVIVSWPTLIRWLGRYRQWDERFIHFLAQKRWHVAIFFLLIQLVWVHHG